MIIVEGPDGGGKTTLLTQLAERYDLEVAPRVVSKDTKDMVDLQQWVDQNVSEGHQYKLFDRHRLVSEFIYGPVLRPVQRPGFGDKIWVITRMRDFYNCRPLIIYCLPPLEVVKVNIADDPDNEVVRDHIDQIYTAYLQRAAFDFAFGNAIIWDYTTDGAEEAPLSIFDDIMAISRGRAGIV